MTKNAFKCIYIYGVFSALTLVTVAVLTIIGDTASTFMWVRAVILLAVAPLLHRLLTRAEGGSRTSLERVRTITTIMPIAIVGVDLIPGLCPPWYATMQGLSAIPLVAVAFLTRAALAERS
ncbi:hypothetical protein [Nonomuraea sp. NPDC049504]|uniref:hypothetical protein n=1 Tax=Nonomuraea sp. NPDC049504 TaxID=3154729 RepID=UPI003431D3DF